MILALADWGNRAWVANERRCINEKVRKMQFLNLCAISSEE